MRAAVSLAALPLLIACTIWAYWPGLHGGFLFDDLYNLDALGLYGSIRHFDSLLLYLSSGHADPLGRPLSLLSFLVDANDWPADPLAFKWTNVMLHVLNGVLLTWVLLKLGRLRGLAEPRAAAAAMLGGALWLLHPLWISTTLYVVQREAMLPASCVLIALLLWIEGRSRFLSQGAHGSALMILAAGLMPVIAALCKANGVLLPLLLLTTEFTLLAEQLPAEPQRRRLFVRLRAVLLGLPSLALLLAFIYQLSTFSAQPYEARGWTGYQHLISEPRVLIDYLHQLLVPRASVSGLFNDLYPVSTDLLHPATTLPAIIIILVLAAAGILLRRRLPLLAFAILFYLAAHLLESSAWPLELYFEHRNYLAAMPLFWPFAVLVCSPPVSRWLATLIAVVLIGALALLTHSRAALWGNPHQQARLMMSDPRLDSPRATITAANDAITSGQAPIAAHWLRRAITRHPDNLPLALTLITADCAGADVPPEDFAGAVRAIKADRPYLSASAVWFDSGIALARDGGCHGFDWASLDQLFAAATQNPGFATQPDYDRAYWHSAGEAALARDRPAEALQDFNRALLNTRNYSLLLAQLAYFGTHGRADLGLAHLDYFNTLTAESIAPPGMQRVHQWLLKQTGFRDAGLQQITTQLREDAAAARQAKPGNNPRQ